MHLTYRKLKLAGACSQQLKRFRELFPDGVDVTAAACASVAKEFDWDWAARNLLPSRLRAGYEAKRAPLWDDYQAKRTSLWADYEMWADCEDKRALLWDDYEAKCALLFGRLAVWFVD